MDASRVLIFVRKGLTILYTGIFLTSFVIIINISHAAAAFTATSFASSGGITNNSAAISTAVTPTIDFTPATTISSALLLTITLNGLTTTATLASTDLTPGGGCSGTPVMTSISSGTNNPVLSITGLTCTGGSAATLAIAASRVSTLATAANYSILFTSPTDSGGFLFYVGNENQVLIRAFVNPTITFIINNSSDTALGNVNGGAVGPRLCDMGNISAAAGICEYRLHIATNAPNGYTVSLQAGGRFTNGTYNFTDVPGAGVAATAGSGSVISGTAENYGLQLTEGTTNGTGTITRGAAFPSPTTNYYPVPTSSTTLYTSNGTNNPTTPDTTNTALVAHSAVAGGGTATGQYTQTVTYTVNPSF